MEDYFFTLIMISSDFRTEARRKLDGKWGKVALITFMYSLLFFVLNLIKGLFSTGSAAKLIIAIAIAVIEVPLAFGLIIALFKVYKSEDVKTFDFCSLGFSNFAKSWKITFHLILKMIVPVILIIVSIVVMLVGFAVISVSASISSSSTGELFIFAVIGFILYMVALVWSVMLSYSYAMAYVIAADHPEMEAKEAVLKSKEIMTGNRSKLFCLHFSFIGWAILSALTLGIGYFWLLPYMQFATFSFYKYITEKNENATATIEDEAIRANDSTDSLN